MGIGMFFTLLMIGIAILFAAFFAVRIKSKRNKLHLDLHSITPDELHNLLASRQEIALVDVRQPLDLLANSEIIPGAMRLAPREVLENPSLLPNDKDAVVYCTCPDDNTSRAVLRRAESLHFSRVKFLKGGLAGWKAKGYPVVPYEQSFHLDTRT